jgi:predicted ATPase
MWITGIELKNIRGFKELPRTDFSQGINILIGPNNSGKSTILYSIFFLQRPNILNTRDTTLGTNDGEIHLYFQGRHRDIIALNPSYEYFHLTLNNLTRGIKLKEGQIYGMPQIPEIEPNNLIYPYLSKRKTAGFIEQINEQNVNSVTGTFSNLYNKIDRLINPEFESGNRQYIRACNDILGFQVSTQATPNGKQAIYLIKEFESIPLSSMGEGVTNILGLVTDLCIANNNIFLIEEPENDIHPKALKTLLDLIEEKSVNNQFFISTHSNIVMKHLGGMGNSKLFYVSNEKSDPERPKLFLSQMREIENAPESRRKILEDLGYDLFDFDLWKGWLFLEESSAEVIIRDNLIRWFVPKLKYKLRTFSSGSCSMVINKFEDFNRLFVFLHLEPTYKNKVWVYLDFGEKEKEIIERLKITYIKTGWNLESFNQFTKHDFERYYPRRFQKKVRRILAIKDKQTKRKEKQILLEEIKEWIKSNNDQAKKEFSISAIEIIKILKSINNKL